MANQGDTDFSSYHIMIDGFKECGKTSLVNRFITGKFDHEKKSGGGYDVKKTTLEIEERKINTVIWDMSKGNKSQQENQNVNLNLNLRKPIKAMSGVMVVYDVNNRKSYVEAKQRVHELQQIKQDAPILLLVGNKIDRHQREVPEEEASNFARSKLVRFVETSALSGYHVQDAFHLLFKEIFNLEKFNRMFQKAASEINGFCLV